MSNSTALDKFLVLVRDEDTYYKYAKVEPALASRTSLSDPKEYGEGPGTRALLRGSAA